MKTIIVKQSADESTIVNPTVIESIANKPTAVFKKISKISIYLLVSLIPLWFLPITQEILNYQKQALLVVLVLVALIAWLAKIINQGELNIRLSWLHIPVLILVIVSAISSITSVWRYGSFWGWPLNVVDSFLTILFFAILYFLISNLFDEEKDLLSLFSVFIVSTVLAGIYAILQLYQIFIIPFSFAKVIDFNTIGSVNSVAILAAVLLPFSMTLSFALKGKFKWLFWSFTALLLLIVFLMNFFSAWIVLIAGLLVLLIFGMCNIKKRMEFGWISFPMVILIISLFFLFFRFLVPGAPVLPVEVYPSRSFELSMFSNVFKQNPLLGTGPGTFVYDYIKYRQVSINQTIFWGTKFTSGASEIFDWFITKGILGGLSLIATIITALVLMVKILIKSKSDSFSWMIGLGMMASFSGMAVAQIMYYSNFTLFFLFWLLLAGLGIKTTEYQKKISIAPPSFLAVVSSSVFLLTLIVGLGLLFIGGQKYMAEVQYLKGAKLIAKGDTENGITKILSATKLNPSVDLYWRDLSQLYLSQINQITADKSLSDEQKKQQSQDAVNKAIVAVNQVILINPANVENWNVRGFIYRNLIGIEGADIVAIESYNKASQLEPTSPFSFTELGRVYLAQAQILANQKDTKDKQEEALNKTLESLNKAVALKADYAPAHYLIALVYDQQGKSDEAILKLEETTKIAPNDLGLAFQLGVIYYQKNQFDNARVQFERAKGLNPDYANARYILGLVYDKQGQKNKAIEEFKKVLQLNPDNDQVKKILNNLNSGKTALDGIEPASPPIQETPPEINKDKKK